MKQHPADALADAAGTTLRKVARSWPTGRIGMAEKQIENRINSIRRAVKKGVVNQHSAANLAHHLKCDVEIFLWGYEHWEAKLSPGAVANAQTAPGGPSESAADRTKAVRRPRQRQQFFIPPEVARRMAPNIIAAELHCREYLAKMRAEQATAMGVKPAEAPSPTLRPSPKEWACAQACIEMAATAARANDAPACRSALQNALAFLEE